MLTGGPPFTAANRKETINKILKSKVAFPKFLTSECQKLLKYLLKKNPKERLGSGVDDAAPIKAHPWFAKYHMNWTELYHRRIKPPYVPEVVKKLIFVLLLLY